MSDACKAELCPMWGGDDCLCDVFGLDLNNPPRNGTFTVTAPIADAAPLSPPERTSGSQSTHETRLPIGVAEPQEEVDR